MGELPLGWMPGQLLVILLVAFGLLAAGFSKARLDWEAMVVLLACHYLVVCPACWLFFLFTTALGTGTDVVAPGPLRALWLASFWSGVVAATALVGAIASALAGKRRHPARQRWTIVAAAGVVLVGVAITIRTPIAFARMTPNSEVSSAPGA